MLVIKSLKNFNGKCEVYEINSLWLECNKNNRLKYSVKILKEGGIVDIEFKGIHFVFGYAWERSSFGLDHPQDEMMG